MILSDDRVYYLTNLILSVLKEKGVVLLKDDASLKKEIRLKFFDYLKKEDLVDDKVRKKITSLSRGVHEGSREWEVLYRKYYEEELKKS